MSQLRQQEIRAAEKPKPLADPAAKLSSADQKNPAKVKSERAKEWKRPKDKAVRDKLRDERIAGIQQ